MIGFFGTGFMGAPIARNLLRHDYPLTVWNRTPARYAELVAAGAIAAATPREAAAQSDVLISMLVEPAHLDGILHGPDGILAGLRPGSLFIDMSTGPPRVARQLERLFAEHSSAFLDAPVRGGVGGATDGTLLVMAGGEQATFERALPILQSIGRTVIHAGPAGAGRIAKTALSLVAAVTVQAIAEAMALAKAYGADQNSVRAALLEGTAVSPLLKTDTQKIVERNWKPGLPLWVYTKDAANLEDTVTAIDLNLPVARETFERVRTLVDSGSGDLDVSALYTLFE